MHLSCSSLCQGKMERRRRSNLCLYVGQSNPLFPGVQQMPELTSLVKPWQALLPWLLPTSRGPCSKASSSFLRALYWLQGQCLYKLMRNWAFSWGSSGFLCLIWLLCLICKYRHRLAWIRMQHFKCNGFHAHHMTFFLLEAKESTGNPNVPQSSSCENLI